MKIIEPSLILPRDEAIPFNSSPTNTLSLNDFIDENADYITRLLITPFQNDPIDKTIEDIIESLRTDFIEKSHWSNTSIETIDLHTLPVNVLDVMSLIDTLVYSINDEVSIERNNDLDFVMYFQFLIMFYPSQAYEIISYAICQSFKRCEKVSKLQFIIQTVINEIVKNMLSQYKANRERIPTTLISQQEVALWRLLLTYGTDFILLKSYEDDEIIYAFASLFIDYIIKVKQVPVLSIIDIDDITNTFQDINNPWIRDKKLASCVQALDCLLHPVDKPLTQPLIDLKVKYESIL